MPALSEQELFTIFHGTASRRLEEATALGQRFAYYTSADTAKRVLQNREIWLRSPTCMNDFSEIQHGIKIFSDAWTSPAGMALQGTLDALLPGAAEHLYTAATRDSWRQLLSQAFIACVSEHDEREREYGRLSMWRAYGSEAGVALIFSANVFSSENASVGAYSSPVEYLDLPGYLIELEDLNARLRAALPALATLSPDELLERLIQTVTLAILCVKHPAFREEREWRIFSIDALDRGRLTQEIECVRGVVQPVLKLPFDPPGGPRGTMEEIEEVLIGPTEYPLAMREGFVQLLREAGVQSPETKVRLTGIPLRRT